MVRLPQISISVKKTAQIYVCLVVMFHTGYKHSIFTANGQSVSNTQPYVRDKKNSRRLSLPVETMVPTTYTRTGFLSSEKTRIMCFKN
jgi:hypothetical protein